MLHLLISLFQVFLWFWVIARIGITGDVFGLGTPLDHPPRDRPGVGGQKYYIIYKVNTMGGRVGGRVGSRDQKHHIVSPILANTGKLM